MADIIPIQTPHGEFTRQTKRSVAGVLRDARTRNPTEVLVIGTDDAGNLFVTSSPPDPGNALWLMELAKLRLTRGLA